MIIESCQFTKRLLLIAVLLLAFPVPSIGQVDAPVAGFTDHSLLAGFPDSEIIQRKLKRDTNYRIILGPLERVRGEVIPEDSERLRGDVTQITYEVSQEFNGEDVYAYFQEQLTTKNYELLYDCQGRECGSSNYWANDIFRNRSLYGPERNQYFMVFRTSPSLQDAPYFSLYIITRVNRKIYAYLEIVEPAGTQEPEQVAALAQGDESSADADERKSNANLLQGLREQGSVILPAFDFQSDDSLAASVDLDVLVAALNSDQTLSVYIVAHLRRAGKPLLELTQRSQTRANSLRQALIAAGIDGQRIEAAGVGPLAPACSEGNCAERIELVLR